MRPPRRTKICRCDESGHTPALEDEQERLLAEMLDKLSDGSVGRHHHGHSQRLHDVANRRSVVSKSRVEDANGRRPLEHGCRVELVGPEPSTGVLDPFRWVNSFSNWERRTQMMCLDSSGDLVEV